jgi:tetratricopeptide (TPR) repeat protein
MSEHATFKAGNSSPGRAFGQLWQVPTFLFGVLCLCLVAANSRLRHDPAAAHFQNELAELRHALDDRSGKIQPWLQKSADFLAGADRFPAQAGEAYYLVGSLFWRAGEEAPSGQELGHRSKAEEYLEKALASKGVADKDMPDLKHRLGVVLYRQGQDFGRALELMKDGLNRGADAGGRGYEILLEAILKQSNPNLPEAVSFAKRWLERAMDNVETQNRARITLAELLIRMDNRRDAIRYLEAVGKSASPELRFRSQVLLAGCYEAGKNWPRARKLWEELLKAPQDVPGGKGHALYSLGVCSMNDDDIPSALKFWNQALPLGGEEAQAALLRIGEAQSAGELDAALNSWTQALAQVRRPVDYHNAYISADQMREMIETATARFMVNKNFDAALKLANLYERLAAPGKAELYRAQALEAQARKTGGAEARPLFGQAGHAYEQTAMSFADEERAEHLRRAADCYRQANNFKQSVHVLEEFVKLEKSPLRLAEGLLDLAEAHVAENQINEARQALKRCIAIPGTPSADRALFILALGERSAGNLDGAIEYLKRILAHSPNRAAYEDAQFLHGSLLMEMKKYLEAELKLDAAIKEFPSHPSAYRGRADLADCCWKQAKRFKALSLEAKSIDIEVTYKKNWREKLEKATLTYEGLADDLWRKAKLKEKLANELPELLRLSAFNSADILVELGEVDQAVLRYQRLQSEDWYRGEVEGLIACDRICRCPLLAKSPQEAQKWRQDALASLKLAEEDLRMMPAELPGFNSPPGVRSKQEWQGELGKRAKEFNSNQGPAPLQK